MFSSDKNVETIAQLIEALKRYIEVQKEYQQLNIIEKVVRLLTALSVVIVLTILAIAVLFYLSFAIIHWLEPLTGLGLAYFLMSMIFLALLLCVIIFRKAWIERPLVRFLADTLLN